MSVKINQDIQQELRGLKEELYMARSAIIELMPDDARKALSTYGCETWADLTNWMRNAADKITSVADARPASEMGEYMGSADRAVCPLCGHGSRNPHGHKGFVVPGGLIKHLTGDGNARQCSVMEAAWKLGRDRLQE